MTSPSSSLGLARPCAVLPGAGATIPGATGLTAPHGAQAKGANTANQGTAEQVFFQSGPARPGCDGKLKVLDLFSGIGGFSLGLERAGGFETVAFCEIEEFPRKVLRKH